MAGLRPDFFRNPPPAAAPLLLAAAVVAVYWNVAGYPFVGYDDPLYVTRNERVSAGLTADGIAWALTAFHAANWHPATWISHMLDVSLFGMDAGMHHAVNVLLHLSGTLLLYRFLRRATGDVRGSALSAALFAVHPLHVESVAWIAERKDVLSGVFFFGTLLAWARYRERPGPLRLSAVVLLHALGLASKPMLVTLPFLLPLLELWPFGPAGKDGAPAAVRIRWVPAMVPLLALSAASCVLTLKAQSAAGAVAGFESLPLSARAANAVVGYAWYLGKAALPTGLSLLHPHPGAAIPLAGLLASAALLSFLSGAAILLARTRPHLLVGWLWFLGMLVPVIGLVQVGMQGVADRYAYLPLVGIFAALSREAGLLAGRPRFRTAVPAALALLVLALAGAARVQTGYWRDSVTLFTRSIETDPGDGYMRIRRGESYAEAGMSVRADEDFRRGLALLPRFAEGRNDYGVFLDRSGRSREAAAQFREAIRLAEGSGPGRPWPEARFNLGRALLRSGDRAGAEREFREAIRRKPGYAEAWNNLGVVLAGEGRGAEAAAAFREALRLRPDHPGAAENLRRAISGAEGRGIGERPAPARDSGG